MKHTPFTRFSGLAAAVLFALCLPACGSARSSTYAYDSSSSAAISIDGGYAVNETAGALDDAALSSNQLTSSMLDPSTAESSRKIVYNASLRMETTSYDTTRTALMDAVAAAGGYLESTDQGGSADSGSRYTYYTARIPAENYRSFLTSAGEAGNVTSLNESAQDVTAEYVDVEARLKALNDQRDRLNALADKAETTADLLEIENQLSDVQYQLESYIGQMRLLENQVSYSTVDISLREVRTLTPNATTFGEKFIEAITGGWRGFTEGAENLFLAVVYLWPVVLIVLLVLLAVRPAFKRFKARRAEKKRAKLAQQNTAQQSPADSDGSAK